MESLQQKRNTALILLLVIAALVTTSFLVYRTPAPVGISAPENVFSAQRALNHLQQIAQYPTPVGSEQHQLVQQYLLTQLEQLGLKPEVQETSVYNPAWRNAGNIKNIVARINGVSNSKAILLVAHYDTADQVPGASSSKAGVAAILEVLRLLKSETPLQNDLVVLFADGGETGLLGALAFWEQHPWAQDIGLVINLTARGTSGPVMLTDSSRYNGWSIPQFAQAVTRPLANSVINDLNRLLIDDTDFLVFKQAGIPGFNLAYQDNPRSYQTTLDNLDNLDLGSLQHLGNYLHQLVKHFGNTEIVDTERNLNTNRVYFDILGLGFLHYPVGWVPPLLTMVIILFGYTCWYGVKKERTTVRGIFVGVAYLLVIIIASVALTALLGGMVHSAHPVYQYIPLAGGLWYFIGLLSIISALFFLVYNWALQKHEFYDLFLGAQGLWLVATVFISLMLPGASYAFILPLIFNLIGTLVFLNPNQLHWVANLIILVITALPVLLFWPSLLRTLYVAYGYGLTSILVSVLVLVLGALSLQWEKIRQWQKFALPIAALVLAIISTGYGFYSSRNLRANPQMDTLLYYVNLDRIQDYWISLDYRPDEFTRQVFAGGYADANLGDFIPYEDMSVIQTKAGLSSEFTDPVQVEIVKETVQEDFRELSVRIKSDKYVNNIVVYIEPSLLAGDVQLDDSFQIAWNEYWPVLRYYNLDGDGITLTIPVVKDQKLVFRILTQALGLPSQLNKRPEHIIPAPTTISDSVFTLKTYEF